MGLVNSVFRLFWRNRVGDFEKKLLYLSKEELSLHVRLKSRLSSWRKLARLLIIYSFLLEMLFVGFALVSTRLEALSWRSRSTRILPVFVFPILSVMIYSACSRFTKMRDRRDRANLEKLRALRQAKIEELKEKTNYYRNMHLIQKYDPNPAMQAAAASILVSKLSIESGLKTNIVHSDTALEHTEHDGDSIENVQGAERGQKLRRRKVRSESEPRGSAGLQIDDQSGNLRLGSGNEDQNRIDNGQERLSVCSQNLRENANLVGSSNQDLLDALETLPSTSTQNRVREMAELDTKPSTNGLERQRTSSRRGHMYAGGSSASDGGWIGRLAAMLVGEDPTQCYALICEHCHSHNGLATKEDFPYTTYYCPRCNHLNRGEHAGRESAGPSRGPSQLPSPVVRSLLDAGHQLPPTLDLPDNGFSSFTPPHSTVAAQHVQEEQKELDKAEGRKPIKAWAGDANFEEDRADKP